MWKEGLMPSKRTEETIITDGFICIEGSERFNYQDRTHPQNPFDKNIVGCLETFVVQRVHTGHPMVITSSEHNYYRIGPLSYRDRVRGDAGIHLKSPAEVCEDPILNDSVAFVKVPYGVEIEESLKAQGVMSIRAEGTVGKSLPISNGSESTIFIIPIILVQI